MRAKSQSLDEKPACRELLARCEPGLHTLFDRLRELAIIACNCDDWGYTDKPDCRLCWEQITCELVPKPASASILTMIRVDRVPIDHLFPTLSQLEITPIRDESYSKPGMKREGKLNPDSHWVQFELRDAKQLPDAIALIAHVFTARRSLGW